MSYTMVVHEVVETFHKHNKGKKAFRKSHGVSQLEACMYTRPQSCTTREALESGWRAGRRERLFFMMAAETAKEYAQRLTEVNKSILLDFTRRICCHPRQIGALTVAYYCDHCRSVPLCDCTWVRVFWSQQRVWLLKAALGFVAGVGR